MDDQPALFTEEELNPWLEHWRNMPEFAHKDLEPEYSMIVHFGCLADVDDFAKAIGQSIATSESRQMRSIWFPQAEIARYSNKRYIQEPR